MRSIMSEQRPLIIIDGSSILYRSFYGVKPLHTSSGEPTHAIYGFARALKNIIDRFDPTHIVVAWDGHKPTIRHDYYPAYKAQREKAPDDLLVQKESICTLLSQIGIAQLTVDSYEADDIIFSIAETYSPQIKTVIVTGDKDLHQLLTSDNVIVFDPFKNKEITRSSFIAERNFTPESLLLYHTLLGDNSDNIPGVIGIGEKTAQKLVENYTTLENLYEKLPTVTPAKLQERLTTYRSDALISEKLFTLQHIPETPELPTLTYSPAGWNNLTSFFKRYEIKPIAPKNTPTPVPHNSNGQFSLFSAPEGSNSLGALHSSPQKEQTWTAHIITSSEALSNLVHKLSHADLCAFDVETTGLSPFIDDIVGISAACSETDGYYIPFGSEGLSKEEIIAQFKPLFENGKISKVFHNAKFDILFFDRFGIRVNGIVFDTMIAAALLRRSSEKISLKSLSLRLLGEPMMTYEEMMLGHKNIATVPGEILGRYAAHDAVQTYKLVPILKKELAAEPILEKLFNEIEFPLLSVLTEMERTGITLDTAKITELKKAAEALLVERRAKIATLLEAVGQSNLELNLNSPKQLEELLFDILKLPATKKSSTGRRSTDNDVLMGLRKIHPIPGLIIEYREVYKLLSTYIEPLPTQVSPHTGKVHTTFSQTITATGRLASSEPNMQNIPIKNSDVGALREAFITSPGKLFVDADYSQIELRVLAYVTRDEALLDAFRHAKDIHAQTAGEIFGVSVSEVTPEQRQVGKKINFSIIYGLTPYGLAQDLGISVGDAKTYIDKYFAQYPGVKTWMAQALESAIQKGYVETLFGRRRYVPGLTDRNRLIVDAEKRIALNTIIQGTAADIIKKAMCELAALFEKKNISAKIILQIHDELLCEAAEEKASEIAQIVKSTMENTVSWDIPLTVSVTIGTTWASV